MLILPPVVDSVAVEPVGIVMVKRLEAESVIAMFVFVDTA